ncbi:MAG: type IV pilus secretin PilQ [Terriglobia bacterium]
MTGKISWVVVAACFLLTFLFPPSGRIVSGYGGVISHASSFSSNAFPPMQEILRLAGANTPWAGLAEIRAPGASRAAYAVSPASDDRFQSRLDPASSVQWADLSSSVSSSQPRAADSPTQLEDVSIHPGVGGKTVIDIRTSAPVRFRPMILRHPCRLVIDLEQTEARRAQRIVSPEADTVKDVRFAQFQLTPTQVTRVVADLTTDSPFQIESEPLGVQVEIGGGPQPAASPAVGSFVRPEPPAPSSRVRETRAMLQGLPILPAAPARAAVDLMQPVKINLAGLKRPESPKPGALLKNHSNNSQVSPDALPRTVAWTQPLDSPSVVPELLPGTVSGSGLNTGAPHQAGIISTPFYTRHHFTGKLISLDLRDVDIRDFFRLIHRVSGLNMVVDSDVTGRITMVMDDVPWDEALEIALKDNGLATQFVGNVLRIARVSTLENEAKAQAAARAAKLMAEPLVTLVRQLRYARATDQLPGQAGAMGGPQGGAPITVPGVVSILKGLKGVISPDGEVLADPRDNAVIITDHRSQIPIIEAVIDKLDTKSKQVSIQVRVILANADFTRSLSSVLSGALNNRSGTTQSAAGTGNGISGVAPTSSPLPSLGAVTQPTSVSATGFGAFAITNASARYAINAAITAAESRDQARTISRPTIVTQNNVRGEVQQGVQIPLQMNINNTITVQYVNATLLLSVTPQVTVDGKIFLNIYVNNASVGTFSTIVGPSINTQEATTQVLVPDGGTVVFGGINVTTRSRSATYIPLLGSIPILGNLFKSSSVNDQNQELLFFVSPTILPG